MAHVLIEILLIFTGGTLLGLNFATKDAPQNYRTALLVMVVSHWLSAYSLLINAADSLLIIGALTASLAWAAVVTLWNRRTQWPKAERVALFSSTRFRVAVGASVLAIALLICGQVLRKNGVLIPYPNPAPAHADSVYVAPSQSELTDREKRAAIKDKYKH